MYDPETGKVTCSRCGTEIGNINGDGNFFALIRQKWCPNCKSIARRESLRLAQKAFRERKKRQRKLEKTKLELLEEENKILRERIKEYRRKK